MITNSSMISLLVASHTWSMFFFALLNLWLDDGGSSGIIANFYDKHGLTQQGNVEFMRNFGLEKNYLFRVDRCRTKTNLVPFHRKSRVSDVHPDLNMSEFSRLAAKNGVFLGKVVRFLQFQHWGRSVLAPSWRSFNRSPKKEILRLFHLVKWERDVWHLWGKCFFTFFEKWKIWHLWPT